MHQDKVLAEINLINLLNSNSGNIEGILDDAGMLRKYKACYSFEVKNDNNIKIQPLASSKSNKPDQIILPKIIKLTPKLLIALGMYSGDGNKTNEIGFAQKEMNFMKFCIEEINKMFFNQFYLKLNILEDTKFFQIKKYSKILKKYNLNLIDIIPASKFPDELKLELKKEFDIELKKIDWKYNFQKYSITVSPKKGALTQGQSSREYIINLSKSKYYLPILLKIINACNKTLIENKIKEANWFKWKDVPKKIVINNMNLKKFIKLSARCQYFDKKGVKRYNIVSEENKSLLIKKPSGASFRVIKNLQLDPNFYFACGLYIAEGTTTKNLLLKFFKENLEDNSNLAISFNSSENASLQIFIDMVKILFPAFENIFKRWKVKIGHTYSYEALSIAEKLGVPLIRSEDKKGGKGQGKSKAHEVANQIKLWANETIPSTKEFSELFSHIEFTGVGIPRVQLDASSAPAILIFSIFVELIFYEKDLIKYE